jgi:hypothetical protein
MAPLARYVGYLAGHLAIDREHRRLHDCLLAVERRRSLRYVERFHWVGSCWTQLLRYTVDVYYRHHLKEFVREMLPNVRLDFSRAY